MAILMRIFIILATTATLLKLATGANYTVGAPNGGWDLATNLPAWASSIKFFVGDTLTFVYVSPYHDVLEVSQADYASCSATSPLKSYSGGLTIIPLTSPGKRYFICGTPGHCQSGMYVEIDTLPSSSPSPPPVPSTPPPLASPLIPPLVPSSPVPPPASLLTPPPSTSPSTPPPVASTPTNAPTISPPPSKAPINSTSQSPESAPEKSPSTSPISPSKSPATSPTTSSPLATVGSSSNNKHISRAILTISFGLVLLMFLTL